MLAEPFGSGFSFAEEAISKYNRGKYDKIEGDIFDEIGLHPSAFLDGRKPCSKHKNNDKNQ